ncbi:glycosyltransferase [Providencia rettgeri]|uniref:glycosyltransferase n=1 Tax=Providencia rettgeri TaxID=587 RepID=UPI00065DC66C|nr:glycosyltransferase [Providencia rettgeri]
MEKKIIWFKYFFLKAIVNSKVIVPVSFFMKKKFLNCLNEYQLKSIENKVKVLYAGMFKGGFKKDSYLNNNINIKGEVYFSCGRIIKEKGYDDIALTLSKLPKYFEYTWIIAGIGSYLDEFKKLCTELDIINNIIFLNNVPRQELKFWYEKSDCFILLSRLKESFSLVHLESQFFGIPAIGMNHSGMREAIKNNSTGFLLNDYSELYNILINKEYLKLDKNEIKEFSEKFDTCHQVNILLKYLIDK